MNTANISIFFAFISGLASASPVSLSSTAASSRRPGNWVSPAPVARSDDDHLCYAPTDVVFEYGNQNNQDEIVLDCEKLSQKFKAVTDEQGNITESCGDPVPSKRHAGFKLLGSEGNCSFWSQCHGTDTTNEVTFDYGDIADVIKLATDGLKSSGLSKNSSILREDLHGRFGP
ncbi:hypothetical protein UCDDA912_g06315 [Diaporthe ampelina]|uniref:Ecp2 effector protein domain-containing protein n=1 Tax=Diaporthe ampelina TaxID=1214573 RepID=A0A0G2FHW0_9PEZI|nr:hypothetical protein UCDDA912_g06315 [Diaporthe ampelina]